METTIETYLTKIAFELNKAKGYLEELQRTMRRYEQAGMYPAVPTCRWKDEKYMYYYFANGAPGLQLDSKQRLYIGVDEAKIEEARRLAGNRQTWETLDRARRDLESWISRKEREISGLAGQSERWPRLANRLGLELAGQPGGPSPNHPEPVEGLGSDILVDDEAQRPKKRDAFGVPYNDLGPSGILDRAAGSPKSDYEIGDMHFEEEYD